MRKEITPTGKVIYVCTDSHYVETGHKLGKLLSGGFPLQALISLFRFGPVESHNGRSTHLLVERIESQTSFKFEEPNASTALSTLDHLDLVTRAIRGKRCYAIDIAEVIPDKIWNHLKAFRVVEHPAILEPVVVSTAPSLHDALTHLAESILMIRDAVGVPNGSSTNTADNTALTTENDLLGKELNRVSRMLRSAAPAAFPASGSVKNGSFSPRYLGVKDSKTVTLFRHAYENGFAIEKTQGDHIKLTPPNPKLPIVITSSTPSDYRSYDNLHAQLVRSGMPPLKK